MNAKETLGIADVISGQYAIQAQERVVFGTPIERAVPEEVGRYDCARVFVTSTRSLASLADGPLQRIERALGARHVGTFSAIRAHSPREDVIAAANAAREAKADMLIAVGGGSVIDATKAIQICLWLVLDHVEAMDPYRAGAPREVAKKIVAPMESIRMIAVSTTLSASEFTATAGVTNTALNTKQSFAHRLCVPRSVILDPTATLATPPWLLFCTGVRAVDHAVESYCSPLANPATEPASLQGLRLLAQALPRIKTQPEDLAARLQAQFGMWQSIMPSAAGVPTGASHGIGYVLGGTFGVSHGHTSCVMLPAVLRWNNKANSDRQRALSEALNAPDRPAWESIHELVQALDQPTTLRAVGIQRENFEEIATRALTYGPVQKNPRPIRSKEDVLEILELAW
jgi:maleylacetate reductase